TPTSPRRATAPIQIYTLSLHDALPISSTYGQNIPLRVTDFDGIADFVLKHAVDMVLIGPEEPLVKGIHDYFLDRADLRHVPVIGPQQQGAQLEGSKDFAKQFMVRHGIPTAASQSFNRRSEEH